MANDLYAEWMARPLLPENCLNGFPNCPANRGRHMHKINHHGGSRPTEQYLIVAMPRA